MNTPKTNLEIACKILGWQGGTIHQVAEETFLTVDQILNAKDIALLTISAISLNEKRKWHLKESKNFLNNSVHSMYQHETDAKALEKKIRKLV